MCESVDFQNFPDSGCLECVYIRLVCIKIFPKHVCYENVYILIQAEFFINKFCMRFYVISVSIV